MRRVPLKRIAAINRVVLPESTGPDFSFAYVDIASVSSTGALSIPDTLTSFAEAPSRARRFAPQGATIISTVRTYLRAIARVPAADSPLVFSTGFAVLEPGHQVDAGYLYYACRADSFVDEVVARSTGVSYPAINPSELGSISVPVPPLEEQRRIADFLDDQVALLDRAVTLRNRQEQLGQEALDAEARLLLIPAEGALIDCRPLRRFLLRLQTGGTPSTSEQWAWDEQGLPWYGPAAFGRDLSMAEPARRVGVAAVAKGVVPRFPAGSVLVVGIGATAGRVAYLDHDATGNQQVTALVPPPGVNARFVAWSLWARRHLLLGTAPYTTLPILNNDTLRDVRIKALPRRNQDRAVQRLDELNDVRRRSQALSARSVSLLQERRQALITAAVTGQLDVTTARRAA